MLFARAAAAAFFISQICTGAAFAGTVSGQIVARGTTLVFEGPGLQQPDEEGHFAIGLRLPQPQLKAANCDANYVVVGLGSLNKPQSQLTPADRDSIARNGAYYEELRRAARDGEPVTLSIFGDAKYLVREKGGFTAAYCIVSIDEHRAINHDSK